MAGRIDARLKELGITLPPANAPFASFQPVVVVNGLAFVAGQPPVDGDKRPHLGRLGAELTIEQGQAATRLSALNVIAQLKAALDGDLDRVVRCVKLGVFINCALDFKNQPQVANGASDVVVEIWGGAGRHARFAAGTIGPMDFPCSVEAIFQVA
jgi:enamine deaminase RidA (YjgF/YER057c/UK114 family)